MEKKINIAELLKDCPSGMELDSTLFDDIYFDCIDNVCDIIKCYIQESKHKIGISFDKYGHYSNISKSKCVIFPKGKTTWEGFQRPFKDGDIIFVTNNESYESFHYKYIAIFKEIKRDKDVYVYGLYSYNEDVFSLHPYLCEITNSTIIKFATKEEKQKLFDAIKANGYKWNPETKTLEKLPKFKVGDRIILKDNPHNIPSIRIKAVTKSQYILENEGFFYIDSADEKYVLEDKFDINTLVPFESRVLVRSNDVYYWKPAIFGFYDKVNFYMLGGSVWKYCIPYKGNEHLLGTANDCDEYYKTWE